MLRQDRVYETDDCGAERKMTNSLLLAKGRSSEEKEIWAGKVLLMFR